MQEQINQHLKTIRLGAIAQEERRQAAIELSEILGSEALKTAAIQLRKISRAEADFVAFDRLQMQDGLLWKRLNEALTDQGYPPAITVKEAFRGVGKPTAQQIGAWYGDTAVEYIQEQMLAKPDRMAQLKYLEVLGFCDNENGIEGIAPFIQSTDEAIRQRAATALGNYQTPEALKLLIELTGNGQGGDSSRAIAAALGNFSDVQAVEHLKVMLETHKDTYTRREAGKALVKLGQVDAVADVMNTHSEKFFQSSAAEALAEMADSHPEVIDDLLQAAQNHSYFMVRITVIRRLGEIKEARAFDVLTRALQKQGYSVKIAAAESLVYYGDRAIPSLEQALEDTNLPGWAAKQNKPTVGQCARESIEKIKAP